MLGFFSFILNSRTNYNFFHLDAKILIINTNSIIKLLYYVYYLFCFHCECTQIKADLYRVIINY